MNTKLRTRTLGLAALALTASMSLAACGSESPPTTLPTTPRPRRPRLPPRSRAPEETEDAAMAQTRRSVGCAAIPTDRSDPGSFQGMADEPVATAASDNPLLKTLVAAVTEAGLVDTLNSAESITVFAPTDDAFAKIPAKDLKALLKDKATLTAILTHHVVAGQLSPGGRCR